MKIKKIKIDLQNTLMQLMSLNLKSYLQEKIIFEFNFLAF